MSWRNDQITQKQKEFIDAIQESTGVQFTGTTKGEASDYIGANVDKHREIQSEEHDNLDYVSTWALAHGYF